MRNAARRIRTVLHRKLTNTGAQTIQWAAMLLLAVMLSACRDGVVEPIPDTPYVARDRAALEALYHATDGPNWDRSENWLTSAPLEEWHGVVTDSAGLVMWLTLPANGLKGPLPLELGDLSALQYLGLADNQLSGPDTRRTWGCGPARRTVPEQQPTHRDHSRQFPGARGPAGYRFPWQPWALRPRHRGLHGMGRRDLSGNRPELLGGRPGGLERAP